MNKTELIEAIASSTEMTKTDVDKVVTAFVDVVTEALVKGDRLQVGQEKQKEEKEQDVIQELVKL